MNILKTPHQMVLEEAGAMPFSDGLLKTPRQLLFEESGLLPKFADGGDVEQPSPAAMRAEMMAGQQATPAQEEPMQEEPVEQEVPEKSAPQLKNQKVFDELRAIMNNPGTIPVSSVEPKLANILIQIFGPNIFGPEQES